MLQTTTTKSRLNALFLGLGIDAMLYQRDHVWRLATMDAETIVDPHDMNLVHS